MRGNLVQPPPPPEKADKTTRLKYYLNSGFYFFKKFTKVTTADICERLGVNVSTFGQWRSNKKKGFPIYEHLHELHLYGKEFGKTHVFPYRPLDIWYMITGEIGTELEREQKAEIQQLREQLEQQRERIQQMENDLAAYYPRGRESSPETSK